MAKAQAKADAIIAEREAAGRKAMEDAAAFMATQGGGASVGGPTQAQPPSFDPSQPLPPMREVFKQAFEHAKDSFGEMFDDRAGIIDPGPGANMNKPPPELEDPAEREQWAASEREARDEARAPYLAATPPAVELTRFATTGRTQFEEVIERLRQLRPRAGVRRLPRARPLRAQPQQREQGPRRVGDRACARRGGRGRGAHGRLRPRRLLGRATLRRAGGVRRGRRRRAGAPRQPAARGLLRPPAPPSRPRQQHRRREVLARAHRRHPRLQPRPARPMPTWR